MLESKLEDFRDFEKIEKCASDVHRAYFESLERKGTYTSKADFMRQYTQYKLN